MTTDDDWAPLPRERQLTHPGEFGVESLDHRVGSRPPEQALPSRPVGPELAPAFGAAAAPSLQGTEPAPPDPFAEEALRELKERLASAPPAKSLIAESQHRARRAERRQRAASQVAAALAKAGAGAEPPLSEPPPPASAKCETGADARESEPWFRNLPARERERLRAHWWLERHRYDGEGRARRRRVARALGYGALLFLVLGVCQSLLLGGLGLIPPLVAGGAMAAAVAELFGAGRLVYAICGGIAFVVVMGPTTLVQPLSLAGLLLCAYGMGTLGLDAEMRKSGGFGER